MPPPRLGPHATTKLLCIYVTLCVVDRVTALQYLFLIESNGGAVGSLAGLTEGVQQSLVSYVDDSPFESVSLPFSFPFFGAPNRVVHISPNGALHFDYAEPCCAGTARGPRCFFGSGSCDLNTSYTNLIAACLMDFNPQMYSSARVLFKKTSGSLVVEWVNVPMYTTSYSEQSSLPRFSFSAAIFPSGGIELRWFSVADPVHYPHAITNSTRQWIVGVRDIEGASASPAATNSAVMQQWETSAPGFYPPRSAVTSSRKALLCPLGDHGCSTPRMGPATQGTRVYITSENVGCFEFWSVRLRCFFGTVESPSRPVFDAEVQALVCTSPALSVGVNYTLSLHLDADLTGPSRQISLTPRGGTGSMTYTALSSDDARLTAAFVRAHTVEASDAGSGTGLCQDCAVDGSMEGFNTQPGVEGLLVRFCQPDCAGVLRGGAALDACNICSGGSTGKEPNASLDCAGVCYGHATRPTNRSCVCEAETRVCQEEQNSFVSPPYVGKQGSMPVDFVQVYQLLVAICVLLFVLAELAYCIRRLRGSDRGRLVPPWRSPATPSYSWLQAPPAVDQPQSVEPEDGLVPFMDGSDEENDGGHDLVAEWPEPHAHAHAHARRPRPEPRPQPHDAGFGMLPNVAHTSAGAEDSTDAFASSHNRLQQSRRSVVSSSDSDDDDDDDDDNSEVIHMTLGSPNRSSSLVNVNLNRLGPGLD